MLRNLNRSFGSMRICGIPYVGVLASEIPVDGDFPAMLLDDIAANDPPGTRYRVEILTFPNPAQGKLFVSEKSELTFTPINEEYIGRVSGLQRIYKDDIAVYGAQYQILNGMTVVSNEFVGEFNVNETLVFGPVSRQIACAYDVLMPVARNVIFPTGVLSGVSANIMGSFAVQEFVKRSITPTYDVLSEIEATMVTTDIVFDYLVKAFVKREVNAAYDVYANIARNINVSFAISENGEVMSFIPSEQRTLYALAGKLPFKAGSNWDMTDPYKPAIRHDPNAVLEYTVDFEPYCTDISTDIGTHTMILTGGLINQGSSVNGFKITVWIAVDPAFVPSDAHEVTFRIRSNSLPERQDDRTIALILVNK